MKIQGSKIVVIGGCGTVGSLMARVLKDKGADVTVSDLSTDSPQIEILKNEGIKLNLGEHSEELLKNADIIAVAPSLLKNHKLTEKIRKITDSDIISIDEVLSLCKVDKPVIGVTGTNGKTTTTWILKSILNTAGHKVPEHMLDMQGNTELIPSLQARLDGKTAVLEIGTFGIPDEIKRSASNSGVSIGIITNISRDHLSNSGKFTDYIKCKGEIIEIANSMIFNADDPIIACLEIGKKPNKSLFYGIEHINSDFNAYPEERKCPICEVDLEYNIHYLGHLGIYECSCGFKRPDAHVKAYDVEKNFFTLVIGSKRAKVNLKNNGIHNVYNALAAACGAHALGIDFEDIVQGIESFEGVKGRFQEINVGKRVIIDYAHNPAGVKAIIQALLQEKSINSKLIVVNTISSESGIKGDMEIAKILKDVDIIVVASNASRNAISEIEVYNQVILTESSKKSSKKGTLGASKEQVEESLKYALKEAGKDDIVLVIGEGGVKYSAEILEKFKN
ncbi:MAG: UDP-N-acetylmuramyl tripeptide synthetase-like protein [Methanobacterium sp.]|uniref:Mur ligase family protein n=1 Tax=Methanobacterium sp. TaxID=2164 RepID=UPI003D65C434|nr:UDP-N-acetylmuramyl tripeptide synthetase-like protein [Methanobacterium sp.]